MSEGEERLLLRYRYPNGRLQAAMPMWSVADDTGRRLGWLPVGSEVSYWATPDGKDPRTVPLDRRFTDDLTTSTRTWSGTDVLRVFVPDEPYQVAHFFIAGEFAGWYVNFESPGEWSGAVVESRDWHLDLAISPDGTAKWKDEEEASAALEQGHLQADELDLARSTGDAIMADLPSFLQTVGDWRTFRPPSEWGPLSLPDGWDDGGRLHVL